MHSRALVAALFLVASLTAGSGAIGGDRAAARQSAVVNLSISWPVSYQSEGSHRH